jgi:hypothetical protein
VIPAAIDPEGILPTLLCVINCHHYPRQHVTFVARHIGPQLLNALAKLAFYLGRLGESNPRPTHYEKPGTPLQARYLHR